MLTFSLRDSSFSFTDLYQVQVTTTIRKDSGLNPEIYHHYEEISYQETIKRHYIHLLKYWLVEFYI